MLTIGEKLKVELRKRAQNMTEGTKFATEAELCAEFNVSRMTVNKAIRTLVDEGLVVRYPRRGTFVKKAKSSNLELASNWMMSDSIFEMKRHKLVLNLYEYGFDYTRPAWEEMLVVLREELPRIDFEVTTDAAEANTADIIWACNRDDLPAPSHALYSTNEDAIKAIASECSPNDYFQAAWPYDRAACPFELSSSIIIWNQHLLDRIAPTRNGKVPGKLVDFILNSCNWRAPDFPPVASYLFCALVMMQWVADGVLGYNPASGEFDFTNPGLKDYLNFNREMFHRLNDIQKNYAGSELADVLHMFSEGNILAIHTFSSSLKFLPTARIRNFAVNAAPLGKLAPVIPIYLGIGHNCRNYKAAAAAIGVLCGERCQKISGRFHNNIPARRETAFSPEFLDTSPRNMLQVVQMLDNATALINHKHFFTNGKNLANALGQYIIGEIEFPELFKILQPKGD